MKYLIMGLIFLVSLQACQPNTNHQAAGVDAEKERAAILEAIENETLAFYSKDPVKWGEFFVHSPKLHWVCVEPDATLRASGWEDLSQFVAGWMKENPQRQDYGKSDFQNGNVSITLEGNLAFVTFEGANLLADNSKRPTVSSRVMVKEDGRWKILSMVSYPKDTPANSTPNVYVHQVATH